jgi:hypothetical protein
MMAESPPTLPSTLMAGLLLRTYVHVHTVHKADSEVDGVHRVCLRFRHSLIGWKPSKITNLPRPDDMFSLALFCDGDELSHT